jgi:hypothetical protein
MSFADAVAAYELVEVPLDLAAVPAGDLVVVGEPHGAEQTARVLFTLMRRLGFGRLALEWPEDELAPIGCEAARLGELPPGSEALSGEGRFSAGLFALVAALPKPPLLLDVRGDHDDRSAFLLQRLVTLSDPREPTLALVGAAHAARMHESGIDAILLDYDGGRVTHRGERELERLPELGVPRLQLGPAEPAVVA